MAHAHALKLLSKIALLGALILLISISFGDPSTALASTQTLLWSDLGLADEAAVSSGSSVTDSSGLIDVTVTWSTVTDGGSFIAYSGGDFVSYEADVFGGVSSSLQPGFDNGLNDPDDYILLTLTFSSPVTELTLSVLDVDTASWDDGVEISYNGSNNIVGDPGVNVTLGSDVAGDDESYLTGYEGNSAGNVADGATTANIDLDFGSLLIDSISFRYLCTDDAAADPGGQRIGISSLSFDVPVDYGDAPDTSAGVGTGDYQTLLANSGPQHMLAGYDASGRTTALMLGSTVDDEADGQPNGTASGDDSTDVDDEDGVSSFPLLLDSSTSYSIPAGTISTTNATGSSATLTGFLDFNRDGDFADAGETTTAAVPNGASNPSSDLTWRGFSAPLSPGTTYARFRLSTDSSLSATGPASDGEVEDYQITIEQSPTETPTPTDTPTSTPSATETQTASATPTESLTPTDTPPSSSTPTSTSTSSPTPSITPTESPVPTATSTGSAEVRDPAVTKSGSPTMADIGDVVVFTAIVTNTGNADAEGVVLTDVIPSFFDVTSVVVAPAGPTISIAGNTVSVAMGTVTPSDIYTVTIDTIVNSSATPPGATNTVNVTSSSPDADPNNNSDSATISISVNGLPIPDTGFAPGIRADLPEQPASVEYRVYESLELEIPTLDVRIPIVGVPATGSGWDVTWLDQQAGYLIGTAFPTWPGNSVITGHATLPGDRPGPFFGVRSLRFGDTVIIHAWGQSYAYEIRDVQYLDPSNSSVFQHEELPWVTLITCYGLDETGSEYRWRVAARGVLTAIGEDMRQDHFVSSPDLQRWKYIDGER